MENGIIKEDLKKNIISCPLALYLFFYSNKKMF